MAKRTFLYLLTLSYMCFLDSAIIPGDAAEASARDLEKQGGVTNKSMLDLQSRWHWHEDNRREVYSDFEDEVTMGGDGGNKWTEAKHVLGPRHRRIAQINLHCHSRVDAIQFFYRDNKQVDAKDTWDVGQWQSEQGRAKGDFVSWPLESDEYITTVVIDSCHGPHGIRICYLKVRR